MNEITEARWLITEACKRSGMDDEEATVLPMFLELPELNELMRWMLAPNDMSANGIKNKVSEILKERNHKEAEAARELVPESEEEDDLVRIAYICKDAHFDEGEVTALLDGVDINGIFQYYDKEEDCASVTTLLIAAVRAENERMVRLLLERGADPNLLIDTKYGTFSALDPLFEYEAYMEILPIARLLFENGLDPMLPFDNKSCFSLVNYELAYVLPEDSRCAVYYRELYKYMLPHVKAELNKDELYPHIVETAKTPEYMARVMNTTPDELRSALLSLKVVMDRNGYTEEEISHVNGCLAMCAEEGRMALLKDVCLLGAKNLPPREFARQVYSLDFDDKNMYGERKERIVLTDFIKALGL